MPVIREGGTGRVSFGGIAAVVGRGQNMLEEHEVEISPEDEPPLPVVLFAPLFKKRLQKHSSRNPDFVTSQRAQMPGHSPPFQTCGRFRKV